MNAPKLPLLALCAGAALAALAAGAADVCYEGRLLDAAGAVRANETLSATLRAYETEDAAESEAFAAVPLSIATDDEGLFAATAAVDPPAGLDSFWIGVAPEGGAEIRPRMRVLPAPFAIVSASAELLETDGALRLPGFAAVGTLANATAVTVTNATLQGPTTLRGDVRGAQDVFIRDLDVAGGSLSMLRAEGSADNLSTQWEEFSADQILEVETDFLQMWKTTPMTIWAPDDGFAMVMIRAEVAPPSWSWLSHDMSDSYVEGTWLHNGDFPVFSNLLLQRGVGSCTRLFTFPVRRGNNVLLTLRVVNNDSPYGYVRAKAKVKMVYVGAN